MRNIKYNVQCTVETLNETTITITEDNGNVICNQECEVDTNIMQTTTVFSTGEDPTNCVLQTQD